jgi:hypothetical protein
MSRRAAEILLVFMSFALVFGFCFGWQARYKRDVVACHDAEGRWEEPGGYCVGAKFGSPEP